MTRPKRGAGREAGAFHFEVRERSAAVDWLRAIGIFLVVYGHSRAAPAAINHVVFAFHIPLFFFLSGYVVRPEKAAAPFRQHLANVSAALLPAYLLFAAIGYLAWLLVLRRVGSEADALYPPARPLLAIFYGSGSRNDLLQPVVLWFFPCLLVAQLLLWPLVRLAALHRWLLAGLLAALGIALGPVALPWELETACVAAGFLLAGHEISRRPIWRDRVARAPLGWAIVLLAIGATLAALNDRVDVRTSRFGNPLLFYAAAFCFIFGLFALFGRARDTEVVRRISAATLIIFPLHPLLFSAFSAFYVFVLQMPLSFRGNPWVGVVASLAATALLTLVAPLLRPPLARAADWVRGGKVS